MTGWKPATAMVLAAGSVSMRPITETMPKPLVPVAGKTLLDWGLDMLAVSGVEKAVVNVHYLPDRSSPMSPAGTRISSFRRAARSAGLAGGIVKALPELRPSRSTCSTPTRSGLTEGFQSRRAALNGMRRGWIFS